MLDDKKMPSLTGMSAWYNKAPGIRAAVAVVPYIGGALDLIFASKGSEYQMERISLFLEDLDSRLRIVEGAVEVDEEVLYDSMVQIIDSVAKTRSSEKIVRFSRLLASTIAGNMKWEELDVAVRICEALDDIHIRILNILAQNRVCKIKAFDGLKVMPVVSSELVNDIDPLVSHFELSDAALIMYCSELWSKGLIHDEGVTRWGGKAFSLISPNSMTDWLLDRISEA